MMKRFIGLVLGCFLLVGCEPVDMERQRPESENVKLIVQNQSSVRISKIKYNGVYFSYDQSDTFKDEVLDSGKKATAEFDGEQEGYVFFTLLDEKNDAILEVRTNEILAMPKGKKIVFTITDNTLLVVVGAGSVSSTLLNLVTPAVLRIENGSSASLSNVRYNGRRFYPDNGMVYLNPGYVSTQKFYNVPSYSGYVIFSAPYNTLKEIKEEIKIERGKMTILTIKDGDYSIKMEQL